MAGNATFITKKAKNPSKLVRILDYISDYFRQLFQTYSIDYNRGFSDYFQSPTYHALLKKRNERKV